LEGIRVADLSGQLAGAGGTRFLAAMGADVIRIEDPVRQGMWDTQRGGHSVRDGTSGIDVSGSFNQHNVEKRGVTINLKDDDGRRLFERLVAISDVVCENFAAGVMDKLGYGYERLREVKSDIIYVSNCGFGHTGPYSSFKTWGPVVQAFCGLTFSSGLPEMPSAGIGYSYMDHHGGNFYGHCDPRRPRTSAPHRGGHLGRYGLHGGWRGAARASRPGRDRQWPQSAPPRDAEFESKQLPLDGSARHIPGRGRGQLGGDSLPRRRRLGSARSRRR
jgi:hypothetical protein